MNLRTSHVVAAVSFFILLTSANGFAATPTSAPATRPAARAIVKLDRRFIKAIEAKDLDSEKKLDAVKKLLDEGMSPNASPDSPLCLAILHEQPAIAKLLLARGADPDSDNNWGCTAIYCASYVNDPEIVELLIAKGAKLDASALWRAASRGFTAVAKVLIDKGVDVNAAAVNFETPLHMAASEGHVEIVKLLIAAKANVNAKNRRRETPLKAAAKFPKVVEILKSAGGTE